MTSSAIIFMLPIPICISAPGAGNGLGGMPGMGMGTTLPLDLGSLKHSLAKGRNVSPQSSFMYVGAPAFRKFNSVGFFC